MLHYPEEQNYGFCLNFRSMEAKSQDLSKKKSIFIREHFLYSTKYPKFSQKINICGFGVYCWRHSTLNHENMFFFRFPLATL